MNSIIFFFLLSLSYAISAPAEELRQLPALQHEEIHDEYGQYFLRYVTAEGTVVAEKGRLVPNSEGSGHVMVIEGEVTYIGDDGKTYNTKYTADKEGFKPIGDHLTVAPEVVA